MEKFIDALPERKDGARHHIVGELRKTKADGKICKPKVLVKFTKADQFTPAPPTRSVLAHRRYRPPRQRRQNRSGQPLTHVGPPLRTLILLLPPCDAKLSRSRS